MSKATVTQAIVVSAGTTNRRSAPLRLALFKADGTAFTPLLAAQATHQAASVAADVATLKTDFNTLLTKLQTAGIMAAS